MTSSGSHGDNNQSTYDSITEALRTKYWSWTYYSESEAPDSLFSLLTANLPHIDPLSWAQRFDFGGVYVNGQPAYQDQKLPMPCRVEYYEPKFPLSEASTVFPPWRDDYVIYRDEHILVAYKPPALSSMPAKEQRHFSLKAYLEKYTAAHVHMPSRLDVSAQGIVITSISPRAHAQLQKAFENRHVKKTYLCASASDPEWHERTVTAPIGRDPAHPVLRTTHSVHAQSAETRFRRLRDSSSEGSSATIFSAQPITGRTHQIRVHSAAEGIALLGDRFYGGAVASYLHLVSYAITCEHPVTRHLYTFTLPEQLQKDWVKESCGLVKEDASRL